LVILAALGLWNVPAGAQTWEELERGTFVDFRDGHEYPWVAVGDQVWMAENLVAQVPGQWWFFNNDNIRHGAEFGRLYSWEAARRACPTGWHLPTVEEWQELTDAVDGARVAGDWLKDPSGFAAPLGGVRRYEDGGFFEGLGQSGALWADTPHYDDHAKYVSFSRDETQVMYFGYHRAAGHSVRCVRND
jgi:uncharacterized protein (TIGR02145 family)